MSPKAESPSSAPGPTPNSDRQSDPQSDPSAARRGPGVFLGRVYGVPVFLSPSWVVPAVFITLLYADVFAPSGQTATPGPLAYLLSFGFAVLVALSVFLHEAAHTAMARALGFPVRRIVIHLVGGVSEVEREPETPGGQYLIAVAGPLSSLLLAGAGFAAVTVTGGTAARYAIVFGLVNGAIGVLNLLPGLPLDGGRVLHSVLWRLSGNRHGASVAAANAGRLIAVVIAFFPVATQAVSGSGTTTTGVNADVVWAFFIAMYVWGGATVELRTAELRRRLPAVNVRTLVRRALAVTYDLPLAEAVRRARESGARALLTLDARGHPDGVVSEQAVMATPADRRPWMAVSQVARHIGPELLVHADADGEAVLDVLRSHPASEYVVVEGSGEVVGVLATADVAAVLDTAAARSLRPPRPPGAARAVGGGGGALR